MKHTPVTEKYIDIIYSTLLEIDSFKKDSFGCWCHKESMFEMLTKTEDDLYSIDFNEIKREFWESCNDFDKIIPLKHVFEVKFSQLLNSRICSIDDFGDYYDEYHEEVEFYFTKLNDHGVFLNDEEKQELDRIYMSIVMELAALKANMLKLLDDWHLMGVKSNQQTDYHDKPNKFKLSFKRKTDFIKIISAMYDIRMFETMDGFIASSKQDVMNEFGRLVGEDFSSYSTFLSMAKKVEKDTFMKPFYDLEKKGADYYDKELEK